MKKSFLCALLLLAGCARQPGDIVAVSVPTDPYMQMTCADLMAQKADKQQQLDALSDKQAEVASRDAGWVAIVHVPVASITEGDNADDIARLKGEVGAIDQAYRSKGCGVRTGTPMEKKPTGYGKPRKK
jgi:hypothetical protein